jgi:peptide-N4-(N-acetyl-beta-glucosaminyl)asparagine amidase
MSRYSDVVIIGWGRKLAYIIAFSTDGATDVTRRYVRDRAVYGLPRTRVSEEVLQWIMLEIRKIRTDALDKEQRARLLREARREERELQGYIARTVVRQVLVELSNSNVASDDLKPRDSNRAPLARTTGDADTGPPRH